MKMLSIALVCLPIAIRGQASNSSDRYVKLHRLPTGQVAVVAEGDLEPRSTGSYTVRIYSNQRPEFPVDDFICGIVQARAGTVEDVLLADLDQDGLKELIVTIRSVGTGGYLSADAFRFRDSRLTNIGSVTDLPKNADCVQALTSTIKKTPNQTSDGSRQPADGSPKPSR